LSKISGFLIADHHPSARFKTRTRAASIKPPMDVHPSRGYGGAHNIRLHLQERALQPIPWILLVWDNDEVDPGILSNVHISSPLPPWMLSLSPIGLSWWRPIKISLVRPGFAQVSTHVLYPQARLVAALGRSPRVTRAFIPSQATDPHRLTYDNVHLVIPSS
jgi:hypothetical protein